MFFRFRDLLPYCTIIMLEGILATAFKEELISHLYHFNLNVGNLNISVFASAAQLLLL